jgi:hypothetical protein
MPPPHPSSFDARFLSQRIMEIVPDALPSEFPLAITSPEWPLTFTWKMSAGLHAALVAGNRRIAIEGAGSAILASDPGRFAVAALAGSPAPVVFALSQNYPNPFNPSTVIRYALPSGGRVTLRVYDILGRQVESLVDGIQESGSRSVEWNAGAHASGIYFYRLTVRSDDGEGRLLFEEVKKMVAVK